MKGRSVTIIFGIITISAEDNTGALRDLVEKAKLGLQSQFPKILEY